MVCWLLKHQFRCPWLLEAWEILAGRPYPMLRKLARSLLLYFKVEMSVCPPGTNSPSSFSVSLFAFYLLSFFFLIWICFCLLKEAFYFVLHDPTTLVQMEVQPSEARAPCPQSSESRKSGIHSQLVRPALLRYTPSARADFSWQGAEGVCGKERWQGGWECLVQQDIHVGGWGHPWATKTPTITFRREKLGKESNLHV